MPSSIRKTKAIISHLTLHTKGSKILATKHVQAFSDKNWTDEDADWSMINRVDVANYHVNYTWLNQKKAIHQPGRDCQHH